MQTRLASKALFLVIALSSAFAFAACGNDEPGPESIDCESCSCSAPQDGGSTLAMCTGATLAECCGGR